MRRKPEHHMSITAVFGQFLNLAWMGRRGGEWGNPVEHRRAFIPLIIGGSRRRLSDFRDRAKCSAGPFLETHSVIEACHLIRSAPRS